MQYKYTFPRKVFYYRIVFTLLLSGGFSLNFKRCKVQRTFERYTNGTEAVSGDRSIAITREAK